MSERTMRSRYWPLLTITLALGCSSSPENIGDGELTVDKAQLGSYAATWDGYVEAYTFQSGTDRVHITLDANGHGSFQVGDGPLLPTPTDPSVGYPAALRETSNSYGPGQYADMLYDGLAYPVEDTRVESERIRLSFEPHSAFTGWCEAQTPMLDPGATPAFYSCAPTGWSYNGTTCTVSATGNFEEPYDCGKLSICSYACACDATSCTSRTPYDAIELDAALDDTGHNLVGTLLTAVGARTLRLKR